MLHVEDLGLISYEEARALQIQRLEARVRGEAPDTLYLLEHPTVITLGRKARSRNLLATAGVPVVGSERGGDVTLHAPGQVVGYVLRLLPEGRRDLHAHMRLLEEIVIRALRAWGLAGGRRSGLTGVWTEGRKIASLGVACRRWCTWHGFALNVNVPLELFATINPCGLDAAVMTSMERELRTSPDMTAVKRELAGAAKELLSADASIDTRMGST